MRSGRLGFLLFLLLGPACGKTSEDDPAGESPVSGAPGQGGANAKGGAPGAGGSRAGGSSKGGSGGETVGGGGADETGGSSPGGGSVGGKGSGGTGAGGGPELSSVDLAGAPIYTRVQRLTVTQWENAVTDILRFKERHDLSAQFVPAVLGVTAFNNNELVLFVDSRGFADFEAGAEAAAAIATGSAEALAALYDGDDGPGFVKTFGRRAFRRPLTLEEESKYQTVFALGEKLYGAGFANGAALVIRAMLESPHFLYRTELGAAGDPLNAYELASKLSFWLLGTTPSDSLLDAAAAGELAGSDDLEATARAMLDHPRAALQMRDFHAQLLRFPSFETISKVGVPEYTTALNAELTLATDAFFDHVFEENLGLHEILTSPEGYVSPGLAPLYGLAPARGLELRNLSPARSGYFMQIPYLMLWGNNAQSNPIQRGRALEAALLCAPPRPPSPEIPPIPDPVPGLTTRQQVTRLTSACGGACHSVYMDPLGFSFEAFDGMGRERTLDNGQPVDTTGSYPFAEGVKNFADANELMKIMATSPQVHTCYSKSVTGFALGRDLVEGDRPLLESLAKVSLSKSLKEVVVALVRNPAFRNRKDGQP